MPRKSTSKKPPTFEEALGALEELVEAMENDQLPLEDLVGHYEKGAGLLQHCEKVLEAAKKRIELIEISPPTENGLASSASTVDDPGSPESPRACGDENDDIQLL